MGYIYIYGMIHGKYWETAFTYMTPMDSKWYLNCINFISTCIPTYIPFETGWRGCFTIPTNEWSFFLWGEPLPTGSSIYVQHCKQYHN